MTQNNQNKVMTVLSVDVNDANLIGVFKSKDSRGKERHTLLFRIESAESKAIMRDVYKALKQGQKYIRVDSIGGGVYVDAMMEFKLMTPTQLGPTRTRFNVLEMMGRNGIFRWLSASDQSDANQPQQAQQQPQHDLPF